MKNIPRSPIDHYPPLKQSHTFSESNPKLIPNNHHKLIEDQKLFQ